MPGTEQVAKADNQNDNSSDTLNGVTVADVGPAGPAADEPARTASRARW